MLDDEIRLDAYRRAIEAVVKPVDVVVDAGSGTGILPYTPQKAGAQKVYAIEQSDFADWIPVMAEHNGVGDIIELVRGNFGAVQLLKRQMCLSPKHLALGLPAEKAQQAS